MSEQPTNDDVVPDEVDYRELKEKVKKLTDDLLHAKEDLRISNDKLTVAKETIKEKDAYIEILQTERDDAIGKYQLIGKEATEEAKKSMVLTHDVEEMKAANKRSRREYERRMEGLASLHGRVYNENQKLHMHQVYLGMMLKRLVIVNYIKSRRMQNCVFKMLQSCYDSIYVMRILTNNKANMSIQDVDPSIEYHQKMALLNIVKTRGPSAHVHHTEDNKPGLHLSRTTDLVNLLDSTSQELVAASEHVKDALEEWKGRARAFCSRASQLSEENIVYRAKLERLENKNRALGEQVEKGRLGIGSYRVKTGMLSMNRDAPKEEKTDESVCSKCGSAAEGVQVPSPEGKALKGSKSEGKLKLTPLPLAQNQSKTVESENLSRPQSAASLLSLKDSSRTTPRVNTPSTTRRSKKKKTQNKSHTPLKTTTPDRKLPEVKSTTDSKKERAQTPLRSASRSYSKDRRDSGLDKEDTYEHDNEFEEGEESDEDPQTYLNKAYSRAQQQRSIFTTRGSNRPQAQQRRSRGIINIDDDELKFRESVADMEKLLFGADHNLDPVRTGILPSVLLDNTSQ